MDDQQRQAATDGDITHSLTIEETADRYVSSGHPRTLRTLQRYCGSGHLDCRKVSTSLGDKYFIAPYSVDRHISQIAEMAAFEQRATGRDNRYAK